MRKKYNKMQTEFEVKILDIDVEEIKKKLEESGAKKVAERMMRRYIYDIEMDECRKDCTKWIRLRDDGDKITMTLKEVHNDKIDGTKELEINVDDFEGIHQFLENIGFPYTTYQENRRISYILDGVEIEIDFWPMIPAYLEIEGKSAEDVQKAVKLLGYGMSQTTSIRVGQVFKKYGIDIHDFKELKF